MSLLSISSINSDFLSKLSQNSSIQKNHKLTFLNLHSSISSLLVYILIDNTKKESYEKIIKSQKKSIFTSKGNIQITILDFIERMKKYMKIDEMTFILGLIYLERFCKKSKIVLTQFNIYRLYFISVLIALKYQEDIYFKNTFYAKICGVNISNLNKMEYEFAIGINFDFYVDLLLFNKYKQLLSD
jgi:hypothetical protein